MRFCSKLILTALMAAALLIVAISGAAARSLRVNETSFELIWGEGAPKTNLTVFDPGGHVIISCALTLIGHFTETTIAKNTVVNQATINHGESGCAGFTIKNETMPWNLRYRSFTGTLPRITAVTVGLVGAQFRMAPGGVSCEWGTEVNHPGIFIIESWSETGEPENIRADETQTIPLGEEFPCLLVSPATWRGTGLIRNLPRTAKLRITLI